MIVPEGNSYTVIPACFWPESTFSFWTKQIAEENRQLMKLVADLNLDYHDRGTGLFTESTDTPQQKSGPYGPPQIHHCA
ncbi:MAG TPA: hypothetical protein VJ955_01845 [Desulfuromonadales bacterium]|nr:hypothetical protein [Desulfuromonadales bacterium]